MSSQPLTGGDNTRARDDLDPKSVMAMRITSGITIFLALIQLGLAGSAYANQPPFGCWWVGLFAILTAIVGLISTNKGVVISGCVMSVISLILAFVGVILDGVWYGLTSQIATCVYTADTLVGQIYGNQDYAYQAQKCYAQHHDSNYQCYCVLNNVESNQDDGEDYACYRFAMKNDNNCGYLMDELPKLLCGSFVLILFLFFCLLTYSIFTCIEGCGCYKHTAQNQTVQQPVYITTTTTTAQQPVLVQGTPVNQYAQNQPSYGYGAKGNAI